VAFGKAPGIRDAREAEDRFRDVAYGKSDALRRRLDRHHDGACPPLGLERDGMGTATTTFPAATPPHHLDDLELRAVDRAADCRADLASLGAAQPDEPVPVADHDRDGELEPATRVGHPLDHVHVQDLVMEVRKELVDDLGLSQR
jgi:hypothetical protein